MPYDIKNPPSKLRKLSARKKRQWIHVYNSCWKQSPGNEARCHAMAWGTVNKTASRIAKIMYSVYGEMEETKVSSVVERLRLAKKNEDVIRMFLDDSFPKDKKPVWGTKNLRISKNGTNDWSLVNYQTPLLRRFSNGKVKMNEKKYSVTTSAIQNKIRGIARELNVTLIGVDGDEDLL